MILVAKFGKFKLKLVAAINLSALLAVLNIASTTSNHWTNYFDPTSGKLNSVGVWRSCVANSDDCEWKNGIFEWPNSLWGWSIRILVLLGALGNFGALGLYIMALLFRIYRKTPQVCLTLELGNLMLFFANIILLLALTLFISSSCSQSMWFYVVSIMISMFISIVTTRAFAMLHCSNDQFKTITEVAVLNETAKCNNADKSEDIESGNVKNESTCTERNVKNESTGTEGNVKNESTGTEGNVKNESTGTEELNKESTCAEEAKKESTGSQEAELQMIDPTPINNK